MRIARMFLLIGACYLVFGVSLGIFMAIRQDFQLMPWHAHINLVGWASMAIFGLVYRAFPELAASKLAPVHFWLALTGSLVLVVGLPFTLLQRQEAITAVGSLIWLASAIVFLLIVARSAFGAKRAPAAVPAE